MDIRELTESYEEKLLSPFACLAKNSRGRDTEEEPCDIRTCFQRDRDRIIHSKSFRRLKHKTQVFLAPEGDHYRERLTHSLEVSQLSRTIAKALRLNEDLTEAIALGHDLGHTPFGHAGERALDALLKPMGLTFAHNVQSVRVVEKLEQDGRGLNLTWEVRDGMLNHGTANMPHTLEGQVVRLCDKVAYINHDMDDAIRAGVLSEEEVPDELKRTLGCSVKARLDRLIHDIIHESEGKDHIYQSQEIGQAMMAFRQFMFKRVYSSPLVKSEETKAQQMLKLLFTYYKEHPGELPEEYLILSEKEQTPVDVAVCDYISGMTDQYATKKFEELYIPFGWKMS